MKKLLLFVSICICRNIFGQIPTNGLVAYYPLDVNANDASGNGHHGTINGIPSFSSGIKNNAIHLTGQCSFGQCEGEAGDHVLLPLLPFVSWQAFTVNLWVKETSLLSSDGEAYIAYGPEGGGIGIGHFGNQIRFLGSGFSPLNVAFENGFLNNWVMYTLVANSGQYRAYINGNLVSASNQNINFNGTVAGLGRHWWFSTSTRFSGDIDEVSVHHRALCDDEIHSLYTTNAPSITNVSYAFTCVNWQGTPPSLDEESAKAFDYLCSKNTILTNQQPADVNNILRKDELAKIIYRGLYTPNPDEPSPLADAPNPFVDLQASVSSYVKEAKALSYLEYGDGISVFKRELTHFRPQFGLERKYVVKAMLEAFNIKPYTAANAPMPVCWYSDVPQTDEMYYYILKAREMGFIKQQPLFNPNTPLTRKEGFLILYRILKYFENNPKPAPKHSDYFIPCNVSPINFARSLGISDGNFNAYTKTSFAVAGLMPLSFAHSYNSAATELPDSSYNIIEPLGKGWTHNYNCYLQRVTDDQNNELRYVITWGDGTMNSFTENGGAFTPESKGLYVILTADAGQNTFVYKTKSQVRYFFSKYVLSSRTVWVLTSIKDRNDNTLTLTWTPYPVVAVPDQIRLFKVQDGGGRYLKFSYEPAAPSKIKTITAVTGSLTRNISFGYENNFTDLKYYVNVKGDSTYYVYEDTANLTKNHLLKQIRLPKGNVVDNMYENRKLKSTQMAGQYVTNTNTQFNYTAGNTSNFTESDISTTRNGFTLNTNLKQDELGNIRNAISNTGDLTLGYDDALHSTKPTSFVNSINGLSATTNYDAAGNVTSITKTGSGINIKDSFTYNGNNDVLTYINAKGAETKFSYNVAGNLVKITDALNYETNIDVNANGTVLKVTNPESIFTDFAYDAFGNTTQSRLMGILTASAQYDGASRLIKKTDPNGVETVIDYDVNDLVRKVVIDPTGLQNTVGYDYDKNDNLTFITNLKGGKTKLTYNNYDQLVEYRFAGFTKTYVYNEDGTLNTFTNQNGHSFNYAYNADGTLQSDGYANYTYDSEFNLQSITSAINNKTITFGYDALKRTNSIQYNDFTGNQVQYAYDNNNNVTAITYPGGFKVGYQYDVLDRLMRVYNFTTNVTYAQYTYYNDGRLKTQTNGNGTKTWYGYDVFGRLDSIANQTSANATIASFKFTMDNVGNHLSETTYQPSLPPLAPLPNIAVKYTHDSANRMVTQGDNGFAYDGNGNAISDTGTVTCNYTWDIKDNLLTSTTPVLSCEYDALENRRRKNDTLFVLDILGGSNVLMETNATGNPIAYYVHGLGLICRLDASAANPHYYHYDYRGSTAAITNAAGNITHSYRYGAFGEMMYANEAGFRNAYRYVGKYGVQFEDSSLYFMRARYYSPGKGRFLGEDPVWGVNLYTYAENNPVNLIDYDGKAAKLPGFTCECSAIESIPKVIASNKKNIINVKLTDIPFRKTLEGPDVVYQKYILSVSYGSSSEKTKSSKVYSSISANTGVKSYVGGLDWGLGWEGSVEKSKKEITTLESTSTIEVDERDLELNTSYELWQNLEKIYDEWSSCIAGRKFIYSFVRNILPGSIFKKPKALKKSELI